MAKMRIKRFGWNCSRLLRRGFEFLESRHLLTAVTTVFLADPYPNQAPKVFDRFTTVEINTPTRTPNVLYGQFDVETDPLSVVSFTNPAHGTIVLNSDATFTYTPATNYKGADSFQFTIGDGRGGLTAGTMKITVIQPSGNWSTTSFSNLAPMQAGGAAVNLGSGATTVPRAVDFNGDGLIDVLAGSGGSVWLYQNSGTATNPLFDAGVKVKANGSDITVGNGRVALSYVDMNGDGLKDLVVVGSGDLKARYYKNIGTPANPVFATETILKASNGTSDYVLADIRADVADWNGDGLPDIVTGSWAGSVKIAYNVGSLTDTKFGEPVTVIDSAGRTMSGAYNLNVRIADVNQDSIPDLLDSYNWGNINYRVNTGTAAQPLLPNSGTFNVTDTAGANVDFHALADGPIVDFADVNGDGTIDLIASGENAGTIFIGYGQSGQTYLNEIDAMLAAHPNDLGPFLADVSHAAEKTKLKNLEGALYDYVVNLATPSQRATIYNGLLHEITTYPQYFKLQNLSVTAQPGIPSLAAQTWLTALLTNYYDPATRIGICNAAQFPARDQANGAYRKLVEDIGLILMDDMSYGNDAEAVYQWVRNVPRDVYPGTGITNDWLGGRVYLVRGHLKNIFTGYSDDGTGEYGFGSDAYAVIGDRGSENWHMTVVHHEGMHDMDAYVNQFPDFRRRWGQILVYAAGHDAGGANYLKEDPNTGWYSESLTQTYWKQKGWWNGTDSWSTTLSNFYTSGPGAGWENYGFMRGGITSFFIPNPQESLATQANQFWNSGEGRIQTAINRWYRGYDSDITEVLFYMDVLSQGFNKMQLCENDNYSNQVISYAQLHRNAWGYIDQVTVNGRSYHFTVNDKGRVTNILSPLPPAIVVPVSASPNPVVGKTTTLSVTASADGGETNLIYTWAATAVPTGAPAPVLSVNGANAAKTTTATFFKAGTYTFTVTVMDTAAPGMPSVSSAVEVTVSQSAIDLIIDSAFAIVNVGSSKQFEAHYADQFGDLMGSPVAAAWSITSGSGTIGGAAGLYTAPAVPATAVVTASYNSLTASAKVQVGYVKTWINPLGGSWANASNWLNSSIPNGTDTMADFSTLDITADATVTLDGANTVGGLIFGDTTLSNSWILSTGTGGPLTLNTSVGSPSIIVNNQTATIGAVLAGTKGVAKAGDGTMVQSIDYNFSGGLTINDGTYYLHAGGWYVNPFGSSNLVTINSGSVLQTAGAHSLGTDQNTVWVNGGTLQLGAENYISTLHMTGGLVTGGELRTWGGTMTFDASKNTTAIASNFNLVGNATLSVANGANFNDLVIKGMIAGNYNLTKTGAGTLVLTGPNTFAGATSINTGTLLVDNAAGSGTGNGAVTVKSGTTLGGTGVISGAVTVNNGGSLSPGDAGIGTLTFGAALTLSSSSTTKIEIDKRSGVAVNDSLFGMTTLNCGGTLTITSLGGTLAAGDSFHLFSANQYGTGNFSTINLPTLSTGLHWDTSKLKVNGSISVYSNPPSIVSAATANPNPVIGKTTSLSVLGDDDGGGANLIYTWSSTGPAAVAFSANGTNSARSSIATFIKAGNYSITATIADQAGLTVASTVNVTVDPMPIALSIAPSGSNFTLGGMDQFGNALAASMPFAWPTAGLTVQRSGNLLHLYQTGNTTDVTPAISAASLTNITVVGQDNVDETLTIDQSAGDLILLAGGSITYNGGALGSGSGNSLLTRSISGNDNAVLTAAQIALNSLTPIAYQNVKYFGFDLGAGTNGLLIDHATLTLNQDNAISIGTNVTVDGGMLDYNGHADAIGNLTLLGGGRVEATAVNNLTTLVTSGTLTAVSLICDTLIIGTPTATTNIAVPNTPAVKPAVGIAAAPIPSIPVSITTTASLAVSAPTSTIQEVLTEELTVVEQLHGDAANIPITASSPEASDLADEKTAPSVNISLLAPWPTKSSTEKSDVASSPAHPLAEAKHSTVRTAKERMFSEPEARDAMMHQLALRRASANRRMTRPSTLHDAAFSSFESET